MRLKHTEACESVLERRDTKQRALTPVLVLEVQSPKVISAGQGWSQAVGGGEDLGQRPGNTSGAGEVCGLLRVWGG